MLNKIGESLPQYGWSEKKGSEELEESMHSVQLTNNASGTCLVKHLHLYFIRPVEHSRQAM